MQKLNYRGVVITADGVAFEFVFSAEEYRLGSRHETEELVEMLNAVAHQWVMGQRRSNTGN